MTENTASLDGAGTGATALVIYASTHGHTPKIASRIAGVMRSDGIDVDLLEVSAAPATDPAGYVVVGASLHKVHHRPEIVAWVEAHRAAPDGRPTAFSSVSLSAAEDSEAARMAARSCRLPAGGRA